MSGLMMVEAAVPQLPPEVTDLIIEMVDRSSLYSCALVCSSWLPASRYRLFRHMQLATPTTYEALVTYVLRAESMEEHLVFVRNLILSHERSPDDPQTKRKSDPRVSFFHLFAGHLPNLTALVLRHLTWDQCSPHPSVTLVLSVFDSLRELELRDCNFPSFGFLRRTLSALPSLDSLLVERGSWPEPHQALSQHLHTHDAMTFNKPKLRSLTLYWNPSRADRCRATQFISWLSTTATPSNLRELEIMVFNHAIEGCGFLDVFGPSLPHLTLCPSTLSISVIPSSGDYPTMLIHSSNLKEIFMGLHPDSYVAWATVARMFQSLPSSTRLQRIDITGVIHPSEDILLEGLEAIDHVFEATLFEDLKLFTFALRYSADAERIDSSKVGEAVLKVVQSKVPKLFAQRHGKVRVKIAEIRPPGGLKNWVTVFDFWSHQ